MPTLCKKSNDKKDALIMQGVGRDKEGVKGGETLKFG